jgi:purine-binding chemotaxis protein CheW
MKAELTEDQVHAKTSSFLSFKLADEHFAIPVMKIMEILEVPKITKVPQSPSFLIGVINLRGAVLPVIDTRVKFGMTPLDFTINTCILVVSIHANDEEIMVGALVDFVSEVFEFDELKIKPSPTIVTKFRSDYIRGMIQEDDHFMMVLDIDKVFSLDDLDSLTETKEVKTEEN